VTGLATVCSGLASETMTASCWLRRKRVSKALPLILGV